jgi:uncharacterized lipoprotein YddW (UPF0748 family)
MISAQTGSPEMRGVWISTVQNVDFPTRPSTDPETLKKDWLHYLETFKRLHLNAVIVQVRPAGDAIYPSALVPISKWVTGKSGLPIARQFDLLAYMIQTAHAEGFEFHAWVNPFRVVIDGDTLTLAQNQVFKAHRDWVFHYGREWLMNPGLPEVRQHLTDVISELTRNYAIDAIHFDDYFYPYRIVNEQLGDAETFEQYGKSFNNINDWRRNNINEVMQAIHDSVKNINPRVQIGVSPFAVWRNQTDDPNGSDTRAGQRCYDDLYADILYWIKKDWIDYIAPEVYFHIGFQLIDYETITRWWIKNAGGKRLYIAHAMYKINSQRHIEWQDAEEIPRQITFNRQFPDAIKGSLFFSAKTLLQNPLGVSDILRERFYQNTVSVPPFEAANSENTTSVAPPVLPEPALPAELPRRLVKPKPYIKHTGERKK